MNSFARGLWFASRLGVMALVLALFLPHGPVRAADEDLPVVTVSDASVTEGGWLGFVATLDKPVAGRQSAQFSWVIRGVTATAGVDYEDASYTASFSPGKKETEILIKTIADDLDEGNETFELVLSGPRRLKLGTTKATGTIRDPKPEPSAAKPEITLFGSGSAKEGGRVFFTLSATPKAAATVSVNISQSGSFFTGRDMGQRDVTLDPDGRKTVIIYTRENAVNDLDGSITATITASPKYTVRSGYGSATIIVTDNDPPSVTISAGPSIREGGAATFALRANPRPATSLNVDVNVSDSGDMAVNGETGRRVVTIGSNGRGTLRVRTERDSVDEADSVITASVVRAHRYGVGNPGTATVAVSDGGAPTPRISITGNGDIDEGGTASFSLTASPAPATSLVVSVRVTEDGRFAASGQTGTRSVTIGTDGTGTLSVRTASDDRDEADGTLTATLAGGPGYTVGSPASAAVDVTDGGAPTPRLTITAGPPIWEGGTANFHVWANPKPSSNLQVAVDVVDSGALLARGQGGRKIVTVYSSGWGDVSVLTDADDVDDPDGHVTVRIVKMGERYALGSPASARVDVTDGGAQTPRVSIAAGPGIQEGESASFALTASPPPASPLVVNVQVAASGSFAASGQTGSKTVTIGTDGAGVLTVVTEPDDVDENDGTITAELRTGDGYERVAPTSARVDVTDGGAPTPRIRIVPGADVIEGETASFALTASPAPATTIDVRVHVSDRGGVAGSGETGIRTVTIGSDGTGTLAVGTDTDADEMSGTVSASLLTGAAYVIGSPMGGTIRVIDGDSHTPLVSIDSGPTIIEGETATFSLSAIPAPAADLVVLLTLSQRNSFVHDGDLSSPVTAIIDSSGTGVLEVPTQDDEVDEYDGSLTASVDEGQGYLVGFPDSATVLINDNDVGDEDLSVSVADATLVEGDRDSYSQMRFPVTLSRPSAGRVTVRYTLYTTPETPGARPATPGEDYELSGGRVSSYVVFSPGETEAYAGVRIIDDDEDEKAPETFGLRIVRVDGAEIANGLAVGTILPDPWDVVPGTPVITISAQAAVTEGEPATFMLEARPPLTEDLEIKVLISDAAESDGDNEDGDFVAAADEGPQTVLFRGIGRQAAVIESDVQTFTVATVDDAVEETSGPVTVVVQVSDGDGYLLHTPYTASVIVYDNDGAPQALPALSVSDATASESDGQMWFDVTLDPPAPDLGAVRVHYSTQSGSARMSEDFSITYGTLTFQGGESLKSVAVGIIDDDHDDPGETFRLVLSSPEGATIADRIGIGTIVNTDSMPKAWLARFGRTVAEQALDGITGRLEAARAPGAHGSIAGQTFRTAAGAAAARGNGGTGSLSGVRPGVAAPSGAASGFHIGTAERFDAFGHGFGADAAGMDRNPLLGSRFALTGKPDAAGGSVAFWGRASEGRFDGEDGRVDLDGEVLTAMLGADYARDHWLVGLALAHSDGEGGYQGAARAGDPHPATVDSSLTAAIPYASFRASERLKLWGAAGYGAGDLSLKHDSAAKSADIDWTMMAAGLRSALIPPAAAGGAALALTSDALWARTSSDKTRELAAAESDVSRLRLGLEGSWTMAYEDGARLTPKVALGARYDGGDAETGLGMEVGGGLAWADPGLGLSLDVEGRTLITHEANALKDQGVAVALVFDPQPALRRGLSFSLRQEFGGQAKGGLDALFAPGSLADRTGHGSRWTAEAAYGIPVFGGRFTGSPHVGLGVSDSARDYSVGWRWTPGVATHASALSWDVTATRRHSAGSGLDHMFGLEAAARW